MVLESPFGPLPPIPPTNAYNVLFRRPDQDEWPNFTAQIDAVNGARRSFSELKARIQDSLTGIGTPIERGGLGLRPGGEASGQMIGILSHNCLDYMVLVQALLANTTPYALISAFSTKFELQHAVKLSKATHLFVDPHLLRQALPVVQSLGIPSDKVFILNGRVKGHRSLSGLIDLVRKKKIDPVEPRDTEVNTLAYLVFSSGTSGLPKAVMISHGNIVASIVQVIVARQETDKHFTPAPPNTPEGIPVALALLPFHHSYGLHIFCFRSGLAPMTIVVMPRWDVELALKSIPKYRVSALALVPSMVHQLANHPKVIAGRVDLSSLQTIGSGAAYLPPSLLTKVQDWKASPTGMNVSQGYGMSECTISALVTVVDGMFGQKIVPTATGKLLPGMQAKLLQSDGAEASVGEVGELYLKGPNVALGYWNNEKASLETFLEDGWLRTGDSFKVDDNGNYFFSDRQKDTLKVGGSQVSPNEIEDVLLAHPDKLIIDATVAGVSGGRTSDEKIPRAWVVLSSEGKRRGEKAVIEALDVWHKDNLSKYKWLRGGIAVIKQIPKLPTGKVLRRVLVEKHENLLKKQTKARL